MDNTRAEPPIDYKRKRDYLLPVFLLFTIFLVTLSVAALIVVFAVEASWFNDSFNQTGTTAGQTYRNYYGLWRLCFFENRTCESWSRTDGSYGRYIDGRLNQGSTAIYAWQALQIVFLFLDGSTLLIGFISVVYLKVWPVGHFYMAVLAAFCAWPTAFVGIASLFVFGFSVYNVSTEPRGLNWCFYVNIAAVALTLLCAGFLSIYDILLKRPERKQPIQSRSQSSLGFRTFPGPALIPMEPVNPVQNQRDAPYRYQAPLTPAVPYQSPFNDHPIGPLRQNSFVNPAMISPYDPRPAHQQNFPPRNQFYSPPAYSEDYYPNRNMFTTNNRPVGTTHYRQDSAGFELFDHLDNYYLQHNSPDFIQTTSY